MDIKEKAELRKQFASRINNNSEGMIAGISSDWRDLTFVYDIPFDNEKIDDESKKLNYGLFLFLMIGSHLDAVCLSNNIGY